MSVCPSPGQGLSHPEHPPRRPRHDSHWQAVPGIAQRRPQRMGRQREDRQRRDAPQDAGLRAAPRRLLRPAPSPRPAGRDDLRRHRQRTPHHAMVRPLRQGAAAPQAQVPRDHHARNGRRFIPTHAGRQQLRAPDLHRRSVAVGNAGNRRRGQDQGEEHRRLRQLRQAA
ncbi:hypothetical protein D9M72_300460 [compost metagenome]